MAGEGAAGALLLSSKLQAPSGTVSGTGTRLGAVVLSSDTHQGRDGSSIVSSRARIKAARVVVAVAVVGQRNADHPTFIDFMPCSRCPHKERDSHEHVKGNDHVLATCTSGGYKREGVRHFRRHYVAKQVLSGPPRDKTPVVCALVRGKCSNVPSIIEE